MADQGKVDPMHQFEVQKMFDMFHVGNHEVAFTTSAMWMLIAGLLLWVFMIGGMKRQLVPGRWQVAVEGFTGFITNMMNANIGPEGRKYTPYVFSLFMFILMLNILFQWLPHHPFDHTERYLNTRASLWAGGTFLTLQQNLHLVHHLWPSVPFYNYARLFNRLRPVLKAEGSRIEGLMVGARRRTVAD